MVNVMIRDSARSTWGFTEEVLYKAMGAFAIKSRRRANSGWHCLYQFIHFADILCNWYAVLSEYVGDQVLIVDPMPGEGRAPTDQASRATVLALAMTSSALCIACATASGQRCERSVMVLELVIFCRSAECSGKTTVIGVGSAAAAWERSSDEQRFRGSSPPIIIKLPCFSRELSVPA